MILTDFDENCRWSNAVHRLQALAGRRNTRLNQCCSPSLPNPIPFPSLPMTQVIDSHRSVMKQSVVDVSSVPETSVLVPSATVSKSLLENNVTSNDPQSTFPPLHFPVTSPVSARITSDALKRDELLFATSLIEKERQHVSSKMADLSQRQQREVEQLLFTKSLLALEKLQHAASVDEDTTVNSTQKEVSNSTVNSPSDMTVILPSNVMNYLSSSNHSSQEASVLDIQSVPSSSSHNGIAINHSSISLPHDVKDSFSESFPIISDAETNHYSSYETINTYVEQDSDDKLSITTLESSIITGTENSLENDILVQIEDSAAKENAMAHIAETLLDIYTIEASEEEILKDAIIEKLENECTSELLQKASHVIINEHILNEIASQQRQEEDERSLVMNYISQTLLDLYLKEGVEHVLLVDATIEKIECESMLLKNNLVGNDSITKVSKSSISLNSSSMKGARIETETESEDGDNDCHEYLINEVIQSIDFDHSDAFSGNISNNKLSSINSPCIVVTKEMEFSTSIDVDDVSESDNFDDDWSQYGSVGVVHDWILELVGAVHAVKEMSQKFESIMNEHAATIAAPLLKTANVIRQRYDRFSSNRTMDFNNMLRFCVAGRRQITAAITVVGASWDPIKQQYQCIDEPSETLNISFNNVDSTTCPVTYFLIQQCMKKLELYKTITTANSLTEIDCKTESNRPLERAQQRLLTNFTNIYNDLERLYRQINVRKRVVEEYFVWASLEEVLQELMTAQQQLDLFIKII